MKLAYAALAISLLFQSCLFTLIDITQHELIAPEELKARLGTTPAEYNPDKRHDGMVRLPSPPNSGIDSCSQGLLLPRGELGAPLLCVLPEA